MCKKTEACTCARSKTVNVANGQVMVVVDPVCPCHGLRGEWREKVLDGLSVSDVPLEEWAKCRSPSEDE